MLFGGISLNLGLMGSSEISSAPSGIPNRPDLPSTPEPFRLSDIFAPLTFGLFSFDTNSKDARLLGQHTVRMSPISTAHFNPHSHTFCLPPVSPAHVLVPILVNNTIPTNVRYSFIPLGSGRVEYLELGTKELKAIEQARVEGLQVVRSKDVGEYDEYDDEDDEESDAGARLQKTQSLVHLRFSKPGTIRLDRVLDSANVAARLVHPVEVTVVPCPTAQYTDDAVQYVHCAGETSDVDLTIDIRGVPPLSLQWSKDVNGRKEYFLVEGIEDSSHSHTAQEVVRARIPQKLKVPLSLSLNVLGQHTYNLESVIDGMGNIVHLNDGILTRKQHDLFLFCAVRACPSKHVVQEIRLHS
jgi:nucleoporin POM152